MKKIFLFLAIICSVSISAQRVYRIEGVPQRFVNALGIPINVASYYNNTSDSGIIFFDRNDTTTISFKYKGLVKKLAASKIAWDSITGKPANFTTTYALSNDIQDSILNRVPYENAIRSLNLGDYRVSARGLLGDTLYARYSAGGFISTNTGSVIASYGAGGSNEISFRGFAGQDFNRSESFTDLSFVTKKWSDSLLGLRLLKVDSLSGGYISWQLAKKKFDSLGAVKYGGTVTTNTIPLASGSNSFSNSTIVQSATGNRIMLGGAADDASSGLRMNGRFRVDAGNGNQVVLNNAGERYTQQSFWNNGVYKGAIWWDNTNTLLALHANVAGSGDLTISATTGSVNIPSTVASTSTTTGSLRLGGGLGVAGAGNFGGAINTPSLTTGRVRATSLVLNKDSIPITTSNFWIPTIDSIGTPGTNRMNRRDISAVHTGPLGFDTSSRELTITLIGGSTTSVVIPRGTASGASGITALSASRTGNLVKVMGDNGSTAIFSVRDADSSSPLQSLTASYGISGSPYNGTSPLTWNIDSLTIATKAFVNGSLVSKLNVSDTGLVVEGYTRITRLLDSLLAVQTRIQTKQPLGAYTTLADSSTILANRWLPNRSDDSIRVIRVLANSKFNITDTSLALNNYFRKSGGTLTGGLFGTTGSFTGSFNAARYSMAAWRTLDYTGNILQIGGLDASNWLNIDFYTSAALRFRLSTTLASFALPITTTSRFRGTGMNLDKDSLPITSNRWALSIDTPTGRIGRFDLNTKLNISDTASAFENFRKSSTKIINSDLANSTISGVSLGSNLNSLTPGFGLVGTAYNGGTAQSFRVDTATISTKENVTNSLASAKSYTDIVRKPYDTTIIQNRPVFIDQFINNFYGRGMLAAEPINLVTEQAIGSNVSAGVDVIRVADTSAFIVGSTVTIRHDNGVYYTYFVSSKGGDGVSGTIGLKPSLQYSVSTSSRIERTWFNRAHPGKFYMRQLAQQIAKSTEINSAIPTGNRILFTNFSDTPAVSKDTLTVVGSAVINYYGANNSGVDTSSPIRFPLGKTAYVEISAANSGAETKLFYIDRPAQMIASVAMVMNSNVNSYKIQIINDSGRAVATYKIPSNFSGKNVSKLYKFPFFSSYSNKLKVRIVADTFSAATAVSISQIDVFEQSPVNKDAIAKKNAVIVGLGDSWMAGDTVSTLQREPITKQLGIELPYATIINAGVGGNTILDMLNRFDADVAPHKPDYVILETGTNDAYNPLSSTFYPNGVNEWIDTYNQLIHKVLSIGAKPIIVGVPALSQTDADVPTLPQWLLNDRARLYAQKFYRFLGKQTNEGGDYNWKLNVSDTAALLGNTAKLSGAEFTGNISAPNFTSGTYEVSTSSLTNISSITITSSNFIRVGDIVIVTIGGTLTPSTAGVVSSFSVSLPVSNLGGTQFYKGDGVYLNDFSLETPSSGMVTSVSSVASFGFKPITTNLGSFTYTFSYKIL